MADVVESLSGTPKTYLEQAINEMENRLLDMPQAAIETTHKFLPGIYERSIYIPPWTVLTGAVHKTPYRVRIELGTIAVNTDSGIKTLSAPCEFKAHAGVKRIGRVFEQPVVWVDIYDNHDECRDIAILEERHYVVPECGLGENRVSAKLKQDRDDYSLFLSQIGLTEQQISGVVGIESDLIPMPPEYNVEVRPSQIHGLGMFATEVIPANTVICAGRINGKRTPGGRYINHSWRPNAVPVSGGGDIFAVSLNDIQIDEEIVIDYRESMRINFGIVFQGDISCQVG